MTQPELPDLPVFDLDRWMVAWTPADSPRGEWNKDDAPPGSIEVGPWPDKTRWSDRYASTSGCCFTEWRNLTHEQKLQDIVNGFFSLVLADGIDPRAVHREFWKIDAYRELELRFLGHGPYVMFQGKGRCDPYNP